MLPTVEGDILVYREGDQERVLAIGTAAWFAWLEAASTFSLSLASLTKYSYEEAWVQKHALHPVAWLCF